MEPPKRFDFFYSLKNIPIPSPESYTAKLIEKVESLIKRMRWRAFFFLENGETEERQQENHHGFKTRKCPPKVEELDEFEEDLLTMIEEVRFRNTTNRFQQRLKEDIRKIRKSRNIIVPADKTRNMYEVSEQQYEKL